MRVGRRFRRSLAQGLNLKGVSQALPDGMGRKELMIDFKDAIKEAAAAVAEYCRCDVIDIPQCIGNLRLVDMYEICLDVAVRVKGIRAMTWEEFLLIRECVRKSLAMPACVLPASGCAVA